MEQLLYWDAVAIFYIQDYCYSLPYMEAVASAVTSIGDPRYSYILTFPVAYWLLGATAGHHVLLTASVAEWFNINLKWLLLGNRPYWWVWLHTDWPHLLYQSPVTCETGPGNPSGHVMITLSVLLTCADYVEKWRGTEHSKTITNCSKGNKYTSSVSELRAYSRGSGWSRLCDALSLLIQTQFRHLVWLLVAIIAASRLLISSHFIHQIMCGVVVGLLVHRLSRRVLSGICTGVTWWCAVGLSLLMVVMSLVLFRTWTWLGMDPGFSIPLAKRFCARNEWVRLNTTPLFSLMRATGSIVGVAFVVLLHSLLQTSPRANTCLTCSAGVVTSFILIGCLRLIPMATEINMFYVQSLCMCAAVPLMVGGVDVVLYRVMS